MLTLSCPVGVELVGSDVCAAPGRVPVLVSGFLPAIAMRVMVRKQWEGEDT